jgi:hypothetical protein
MPVCTRSRVLALVLALVPESGAHTGAGFVPGLCAGIWCRDLANEIN